MSRAALPVSRRQYQLWFGGAVAATVLLVGAASVLQVEPGIVVAAALGLVGLAALFLVPVHWLPAISALAVTFVPGRFIPHDGPFRPIAPLVLVLIIWVFRRVALRQVPPGSSDLPPFQPSALRLTVYVPAAFLVIWLAYSVVSSSSVTTSISWTMSYLLAVLMPMLVPDSRREGIVLREALMWGGAVLGAYAFVEQLLGFSPLFAVIGSAPEREWSVYRAFATFSHPLAAASYFTIPAMLALGAWARGRGLRYLFLSGFAVLGVFATVSRGAMLAVAVGAAFLFLSLLLDPAVRAQGRMLVFVGVGIVGALFAASFGPLQDRSDSIEGGLSEGARELGLTVALKAINAGNWLGTGPGTSGQTARRFDQVIIENSLLQVVISIGIPGLLCIAALLAGLIITALSQRDAGTAAAIVALSVAYTGYNAIDAVLYLHILFALLVLLSLSAFSPPPTRNTARLTTSTGVPRLSVPHATPGD
ncbi:O-antigen ligase family protein [Microbacterium aurum]